MAMQTFIATTTEPPDTLLPKLCKRQRYLARQMADCLTEGDRILVYKAADPISDDEIRRLRRAISGYGPAPLLLVRLADTEHPASTFDIVQDDLMLGYIDRFSNTDISVHAWTNICAAAIQAWEQVRAHRAVMSSRDAWS
jgi:hypothetical protein